MTASFASKILARTMRSRKHFALHDPMAVAVKASPAMFGFENLPVNIVTRGEYMAGMTVADRREKMPRENRPGARIAVCNSVASKIFKQRLLKALFQS